MANILENFIRLEEGIPKELHFSDHALARREIRDPVTELTRPVSTLEFVVDEEDGSPVGKMISITSAKLAGEFEGLLDTKMYRLFTFIVTRRGTGFATQYTVVRIPRPAG